MKIKKTAASYLVLLLAILGADATGAAIGEIFLTAGFASGSYGTGSDSEVASTRVIFNTGDRFQFKVDAGWIRVESPYGILPGRTGPVPMRRRHGNDSPGDGRGPSPMEDHGNRPDPPVIEPPISDIEEISASGVGDVFAAFSGRIFGGGAKVFRLDGGIEAKIPTADADEGLGTGEWDARLGVTSEYRFWSATGFAGPESRSRPKRQRANRAGRAGSGRETARQPGAPEATSFCSTAGRRARAAR